MLLLPYAAGAAAVPAGRIGRIFSKKSQAAADLRSAAACGRLGVVFSEELKSYKMI